MPVDEKMQVLDSKGKPVPHLYCIGDANGMLPWICLSAANCDPDYPACKASCKHIGMQVNASLTVTHAHTFDGHSARSW